MHDILQRILFQHSVMQILCLYMFMGLLVRVFEACSHVLFAGRRHGDVTPRDLGISLAAYGGLLYFGKSSFLSFMSCFHTI